MEIDKELVGQRFAKHYEEYQECATVQRDIATRLAASIAECCPETRIAQALEIGMGTGFLSRRLARLYPDAHWYFNDLVTEAQAWIPQHLAHQEALMGDAELLDLPMGSDIVASASALQWLRDLDAFFLRVKQSLTQQGIFAFSSFGPMHMMELRTLTGLGLDYPSLTEMQTKLEIAGFTIIHQAEWQQVLSFSTARQVLEHLRQTGVNSTAAQTWTPRKLLHFCKQYEQQFRAEDGSLPLSYHPILFIAQKTT
ncbi:MAG: malonyl-ACP O-methyltransferase BioC [Akkermansia sp.]